MNSGIRAAAAVAMRTARRGALRLVDPPCWPPPAPTRTEEGAGTVEEIRPEIVSDVATIVVAEGDVIQEGDLIAVIS